MHIAWIGKTSPFCGNVTYGLEVTTALAQRGHRISFIHFASGNASESASELPTACRAPSQPVWAAEISLPCLHKNQIFTIPTPNSRQILKDALQTLKPDLIHVSLTLSPLDFSIPKLGRQLGIPAVSTFHPAFDRHRRTFVSRTQHLLYQLYAPSLAQYRATIIFSELQKQLLISLGVPEAGISVIPNGVDTDKFCPGPSRIKEELGTDRLFVYQGRISPEKNIESLLKAWKQADMGDRALLAIVGDGPQTSTLKPFYRADRGVVWLGYVADEQRRIEILRGADVFILPSLIEGLSISLLEGMACGTAVVATNVGADGEAIEDGAGIVLSAAKVTAELTSLLPLLRDQQEFTQMLGRKARQRVLQRYTLSRNITQLETLYSRVLGRLDASEPIELPETSNLSSPPAA
ncbi:glycosyltransferase family 4 protein [Synechococcus sp. PCC 7336]|uniref:glycosyltransferase family 4 protein n=1 Tax=Synechococcus sp. PCC 7336 TaxID=195250 RepID=UPI00034993A5|nr:glycosyltransferase family 4 protein [Synechococcus sp. PCC 7336]